MRIDVLRTKLHIKEHTNITLHIVEPKSTNFRKKTFNREKKEMGGMESCCGQTEDRMEKEEDALQRLVLITDPDDFMSRIV